MHFHVCYLEFRALSELLGENAAEALVLNIPYYQEIYRIVVTDHACFADLFALNQLTP